MNAAAREKVAAAFREAVAAGLPPGDVLQLVAELVHQGEKQPCGEGEAGNKLRITTVEEATGAIDQKVMGRDADYALGSPASTTRGGAGLTVTIDQPDVYVKSLPARVAHVTHALLITAKGQGSVPVKASEIVVSDWEALTVQDTVNALIRAKHEGLVVGAGGIWIATEKAHQVAAELEARSLADEESRDA